MKILECGSRAASPWSKREVENASVVSVNVVVKANKVCFERPEVENNVIKMIV